jgi:hypothetical protein
MSDPGPVNSDLCRARVAAALCAFVGPDRPLTRETLARESGQDLRTVKAHCLGEACPSLPVALTYMRLLPAEFAADVLALAGLSDVTKDGDAPPNPFAVLAEIGESVAELARALTDGRIDHTEVPALVVELLKSSHAAHALAIELMENHPSVVRRPHP